MFEVVDRSFGFLWTSGLRPQTSDRSHETPDKVALITGAGPGSVAHGAPFRSRRKGAAIVGVDVNHEAANETARVIVERRREGKIAVKTVDVTRPTTAARSMIATAESEFGRLDVLFNNAGDHAFRRRRRRRRPPTSIMGPDDVDQRQRRFPRLQVRNPGPEHGPVADRSSTPPRSWPSVGAATPQIAYTASKGPCWRSPGSWL